MSSYDYQKEPSMTHHRIGHAVTLGLILGTLFVIAAARML